MEIKNPDSSWDQKTYERVLSVSFVIGNGNRKEEIYNSYLKSDLGSSSPNRETWEAYYEYLRIRSNEGNWTKLSQLSKEHPGNPEIQKYLARAYEFAEENKMAARYYKIAAQITSAVKEKMEYYTRAATNYAKLGEQLEVESLVGELKNMAPKVEDGYLLLTVSMRAISLHLEDKDALWGLSERILELDPGNFDNHFDLAYKYSIGEKNELALFHYLKIPFQQRHSVAWNNIGVTFERLEIPGKSVEAYNFSKKEGETLASSNLAKILIKVGFISEAEELCREAMKNEACHQNVVHYLSDIKKIPHQEAEKESKCINKALPISNFYRQYGEALTAQPFHEEDPSNWRGPKCKLDVKISEGAIFARGSYEIPGGFGLLSPKPNIAHPLGNLFSPKEQCEVIYDAKMKGRTFKGLLHQSWGKNSGDSVTSSGERTEETEVLMVLSETLDEIFVYEKK